MRGAAIGAITASKSDDFPVGSYATGASGWTELAVMKSKDLQRVDFPKNGKITDTLGVLGKTGCLSRVCLTQSQVSLASRPISAFSTSEKSKLETLWLFLARPARLAQLWDRLRN